MRRGVIFGLAANLLWGLFPLYWPLLKPAGAVEILAHRMFWSAVTMVLLVTVARRWSEFRALRPRTWGLIAAAAVLISVNWGIYIYAVNNDHVVDASLGYFINPLVSVALGVLVLHERLRALQWAALAVAVPAVVITAVGAGQFPWLALALAVSFGLYGLIKRIIRISAVLSLTGESGVLALPALGYLIWLGSTGQGHFTTGGWGHALMTASAGIVTAVPLLMFGAAAGRLPLSVLGFLQYATPATQFLLGVFWAGEHMSPLRWVGFGMIWGSLALLSMDAVRRSRRRRGVRSAESGTDRAAPDGGITAPERAAPGR
jgi:chloramphenicol-sensitive protein RarD